MKKLTAIAFAVLLALAILSPAAALARSGTDRPFLAVGSGTIRLDTATGGFTGQAVGVGTHLGVFTLRIEGAGTPGENDTFSGTGTATILAADGDRLVGTFTLTKQGRGATVIVRVTGGTGRFAHASGTITITCSSGSAAQEGQVLIIPIHCVARGRISFSAR